MATGAKNLTAIQKRVLGIVEDGGARGVAEASIEREEAHEGRLRAEVHTTLWSLQRRGLVTVEVRRETRLGQYGPYIHETRIVHLAEED